MYSRMIIKWAGVYLALLLVFGGFVYEGVIFPPYGNVLFQVLTTICIAIMAWGLLNHSISHKLQLVVLFIFQVAATIGLREYSYAQWGNYLGANPIDAALYDNIASAFVNSDASLRELPQFVDNFYLDDMGFFYIISLVYSICGPNLGLHVLALLNCIVIIIGAHVLYRLTLMLSFQRKDADFMCFLWGVMPFAIYTSCAGLKENYMDLCIILAMYYVCRYTVFNKRADLFYALVFAASLLLFRTAICLILVLAIMVAWACRFPWIYRHIRLWTVVVVVVAALSFNEFVAYSYTMRGGSGDVDRFVELMTAKTEIGDGAIGMITNIAAAFVGPFVNIVSNSSVKADYITLYGFGTLIKMMLSLYCLYGIYRVFVDKTLTLLPIVAFVLLHSIMLIFTFYTLHDRFQWPHMPFVFLLAVYGFKSIRSSSLTKYMIPQMYYPMLVIGLIVLYNFR